MASATLIPSVTVAVAAIFVVASLLILPSSAQTNVLLTGEVLGTDERLSYGSSEFVMQGDCNLVLYNRVPGGKGFQSNTHGGGTSCTLTLTNRGQFIIKDGNGRTVWASPVLGAQERTYAALLRPDGTVHVYGPQLWSSPAPSFVVDAKLQGSMAAMNVLYAGNYVFLLQTNGQAAIYGPVLWSAGEPGDGRGGAALGIATAAGAVSE